MPTGRRTALLRQGLRGVCCASLIEEAPTALALFDEAQRCLSVSKGWQQRFGLDAAALVGKVAGVGMATPACGWVAALPLAARGQAASGVDRDRSSPHGAGRRVFWKVWPVAAGEGLVAVSLTDGPESGDAAKGAAQGNDEKIEEITAALGIGVLEHDFATGATVLSDSFVRLLGLSRDRVPTTDAGWPDLLPARDPEAYEAARARALDPAGDGSFEFEVWLVVDGTERCMRLHARVLFAGEGVDRQPRQMIGLLVDRTRDRQIEEALVRAQRLETVGRLAGMVAHDFNNILSVILGSLELALPKVEDAGARGLLINAMEATQMGAGFNKRLLTLAGGHGGQALRFHLDAHLGQTWEIYRRVLRDDILLEFEPGSDGAHVLADPAEIDAAILNLVVNARDAQLDGGRIVIRTRRIGGAEQALPLEGREARPDLVAITVADAGPGIPPDVAQRAGEPFFTTKPSGMGSGLGLASVIATARRAGGAFRIGTGPQGTEAVLVLPMSEGADVQILAQDGDMPLGEGEWVLVVEDDPLVREAAMQRLEALGYLVSEPSNAQAALAHVASGAPVDLVFSDIILPGGPTGIELSAMLRRDHPKIAVLLTSGHASAVYRGKEEGADVQDMLAKPYSMRDLAFAVRRRLALPR